jgi:hypothetical protein
MRRTLRLALVALALCSGALVSPAAERKLEARLIWGTNEDKSPDPSHKPLEGDLARKLRDLPFKWKNYFEVSRHVFTIDNKAYTNVVISSQCSILVKDKGDSLVTVKLIGKGKEVRRVDKPLPKGEMLTIGGDDKNDSAWFITVKSLEGKEEKPKK